MLKALHTLLLQQACVILQINSLNLHSGAYSPISNITNKMQAPYLMTGAQFRNLLELCLEKSFSPQAGLEHTTSGLPE